jgi:hypothetical protein
MAANISATFDAAKDEAIIHCSACGVRRIPGKFLGQRAPESAILAHRVGAKEHGIEPCRDPGPFLFENREHIINIVMKHDHCEMAGPNVVAHVHGPVNTARDDVSQRIRCGNDDYEVTVRKVTGDALAAIHRADVAVVNSDTGQTYCLLCPEGSAAIGSPMAPSDQLTALVQTHFSVYHHEVFLRVRDDGKTVTYRLSPN